MSRIAEYDCRTVIPEEDFPVDACDDDTIGRLLHYLTVKIVVRFHKDLVLQKGRDEI
jgi:hypothetical protein